MVLISVSKELNGNRVWLYALYRYITIIPLFNPIRSVWYSKAVVLPIPEVLLV